MADQQVSNDPYENDPERLARSYGYEDGVGTSPVGHAATSANPLTRNEDSGSLARQRDQSNRGMPSPTKTKLATGSSLPHGSSTNENYGSQGAGLPTTASTGNASFVPDGRSSGQENTGMDDEGIITIQPSKPYLFGLTLPRAHVGDADPIAKSAPGSILWSIVISNGQNSRSGLLNKCSTVLAATELAITRIITLTIRATTPITDGLCPNDGPEVSSGPSNENQYPVDQSELANGEKDDHVSEDKEDAASEDSKHSASEAGEVSAKRKLSDDKDDTSPRSVRWRRKGLRPDHRIL
ncbi:hypothetical protein E2P81_ATG01670 [Venturia nashicola]|nr:hypothetical protein E2P81_ATG01670 [Venturia nashicola]